MRVSAWVCMHVSVSVQVFVYMSMHVCVRVHVHIRVSVPSLPFPTTLLPCLSLAARSDLILTLENLRSPLIRPCRPPPTLALVQPRTLCVLGALSWAGCTRQEEPTAPENLHNPPDSESAPWH